MRYIPLFIVVLGSFLVVTCDEPEENVNPYAQEHIPWPSLADSPWPIERHDAQGTGRSANNGPTDGQVQYLFGSGGWSEGSTILANDHSYFSLVSASSETHLYKVTPANEVAWSIKLFDRESNGSSPTLASPNVVYVSSILTGTLFSINADSGIVNWSLSVSDVLLSSPEVDIAGNVYVVSLQELYSITADGSIRWVASGLGNLVNAGRVPLVFNPDGTTLYISSADSLFALSSNGDVLWSYPTGAMVYHVIVDNSGNLFFENSENRSITCLLPSGDLRWSTDLSDINIAQIRVQLAPALDKEGNLYFTAENLSGSNGILSLDNEGALRWFVVSAVSTDISSDSDRNIYFGGRTGLTTVCISSLTGNGEVRWMCEQELTGGNLGKSIAIGSEGSLYVPVVDNHHVSTIIIN